MEIKLIKAEKKTYITDNGFSRPKPLREMNEVQMQQRPKGMLYAPVIFKVCFHV